MNTIINARQLPPAILTGNITDGQFAAESRCVETVAVESLVHETAQSFSVSESASSAAERRKPRKRGANRFYDCIWTRNHAICLMGLICDNALGGMEAARNAPEPLKSGIRPSAVARAVLAACPWLLQPEYLNLEGALGAKDLGFDRFTREWIANRVCYFYRYPESSEHPINRRKGNLRAVYREFYDAFANDVSSGAVIDESRARNFWLSVADRVPYLVPRIREDGATVPSDPSVSTPGGESRDSNNAGQEGGAE